MPFRKIAEDAHTGVRLYSTPVEHCPIHLMRATAIMPCAPRTILQYMENEVRPKWDRSIDQSRILRELRPPPAAAEMQTMTAALRTTPRPSTAPPAEPFAFRPGQRRVALHYLGVRSPVFLVQDRDLELVVAEEVREDGSVFMKAFSPPMGYARPLDPAQQRYVRAVLLLSGVIARPVQRSATQPDCLADGRRLPPSLRTGPPAAAYCRVEYMGLLDPMGLLPPVLVNMVISAQVGTLKRLQQYICKHPVPRPLPGSTGPGALGQQLASAPPTAASLAALTAGAAPETTTAAAAGHNTSEATLLDSISDRGPEEEEAPQRQSSSAVKSETQAQPKPDARPTSPPQQQQQQQQPQQQQSSSPAASSKDTTAKKSKKTKGKESEAKSLSSSSSVKEFWRRSKGLFSHL